jgi:4-aminobutyrate aminotransferase-like enzyme
MMIQPKHILFLITCLPLSFALSSEAIPSNQHRKLQRNIFNRESPQLRRVDHSTSSMSMEEATSSSTNNKHFLEASNVNSDTLVQRDRAVDDENASLIQTIRKRGLGVGVMTMKSPSQNNAEDHAIVNEGLEGFLNQIFMSMNTSVSFKIKPLAVP